MAPLQPVKRAHIRTKVEDLKELNAKSTSKPTEVLPNSVVTITYVKGAKEIGSMRQSDGVTTIDNGIYTCSEAYRGNRACTFNPPAKKGDLTPAFKQGLFGTMAQHEKELTTLGATVKGTKNRLLDLDYARRTFFDKNDPSKELGSIYTTTDGYKVITIGALNEKGSVKYHDFDGDGIPDKKETDKGFVEQKVGSTSITLHPIEVNDGKRTYEIMGPSKDN